jgi:hypothetical protein
VRGVREVQLSAVACADDEHAPAMLRHSEARSVEDLDARIVLRAVGRIDCNKMQSDKLPALVLSSKSQALDVLQQKGARPRLSGILRGCAAWRARDSSSPRAPRRR